MAIEYKDLAKTILGKPDLVVRKDEKLNKQEFTINIGDSKPLEIVAFKKNSFYDILLLVILFRKKHLKGLKKQVILVRVHTKEHRK